MLKQTRHYKKKFAFKIRAKDLIQRDINTKREIHMF